MSIMSSVRSALLYSFAAKYGMQFLALLSTMVVSRMLSPEEIGVFAIASSLVLIISEFRLLGAGVYVIREVELTKQKVRNALGLSCLICWGLGLGLVFLSPVLGRFYDDESISNIFIILSVSFFFGPYISISSSLLAREFEHRTIFFIRIITALVGVITTVVLIFLGASFYSMAFSNLAAVTMQFLLYLWVRPPAMEYTPSFNNFKPIVRIGFFQSFASVFSRSQTTISDLVIGRVGSVRDVAIFSRGLGFINFISDTVVAGVSPVALPYLAKVNKEGGSIPSAYMKAGVYITGITWPVLVVANVMALPAIRLFFGDQWDMAAPIAAALACWSAIKTSNSFFAQAMLAKSMEKILFVKEAFIISVLGIAIYISYPFGLEVVGYSFVGVGFFEFVVSMLVLTRMLGLNFFEYFKSLMMSGVVAAACYIAARVIEYVLGDKYDHVGLIVACGFILPPVWLAGIFLIKHPLFDEVKQIYQRFR